MLLLRFTPVKRVLVENFPHANRAKEQRFFFALLMFCSPQRPAGIAILCFVNKTDISGNNRGVGLRDVYLQAFLLPSARPRPPQNEPLMTPYLHIFHTVYSEAAIGPLTDTGLFCTDNQPFSVRASYMDFNTGHVITSTVHMPASLHSCIPSVKRLIPCLNVCPSTHNVAKERIHFAQTAKADVGGRPPTPYICGKTHMICQKRKNLRIK